MSDYIDTRDGWREATREQAQEHHGHALHLLGGGGNNDQWWVREEPVPPLPTEECAVIEAAYANGVKQVVMLWRGSWVWGPEKHDLSHITGFDVLAVPMTTARMVQAAEESDERVRCETAKAVLDRVRDAVPHSGAEQMEAPLDVIAREFGVES